MQLLHRLLLVEAPLGAAFPPMLAKQLEREARIEASPLALHLHHGVHERRRGDVLPGVH